MKYCQLGKGVYQYYKNYVKGNQHVSHQLAQRKLTRNIALAFKFSDEYYIYGNLHIQLKGNTIVQLINHKGEPAKWFYKNMKKYHYLNKIMKINELDIRDKQEFEMAQNEFKSA